MIGMTTRVTRSFHFLIALLVLFFDREAKWVVARNIPLHDTIQVIPGFFRLTHVENRGAANDDRLRGLPALDRAANVEVDWEP